MYEYIVKINKLHDWFMTGLYCVDVVINILYILTLFLPVHLPHHHPAFVFTFCSTTGVMLFVDIVLLIEMFKRKNAFTRMLLLKIYIVAQIISIYTDIVSAIVYKDFWVDGYVWILFGTIMAIIYGYRHYFLDITQKSIAGIEGGK